jgi:hypothetical protein
LLATRELVRLELPRVAIESQPLENGFSPGRVFESTLALEFMLEITVTLQNFFEIVAGICHAMLKLVHLVFDLLKTAERAQR